MEQYVRDLVENTFKNYELDKVKEIIAERILWYEQKIRKLEEKEVWSYGR